MSGIFLLSVGNSYGFAPVNTDAPAISGSAFSGNTLSSTTGTWDAAPAITAYNYQWQRGTSNISGATSSTYTLTSSDVGNTVRCRVTAVNAVGETAAFSADSASVGVQGQVEYNTTGNYTFTVPTGVTSISVVIVAAGGSGQYYLPGGGGSLAYKNNISVTPGEGIGIILNRPRENSDASYSLTTSYIKYNSTNTTIFQAYAGTQSGNNSQPQTNGVNDDGGGIGGAKGGDYGGGGGAGGYSGNGGRGGNSSNSPVSGSGGGAGGARYGGGGGVGLDGQGSNGAAATASNTGGGGGSGGTDGAGSGAGGVHGGGGEGTFGNSPGGVGGVRIIYPGTTRQFPSTNTADV